MWKQDKFIILRPIENIISSEKEETLRGVRVVFSRKCVTFYL
jgi:hypothetical protein